MRMMDEEKNKIVLNKDRISELLDKRHKLRQINIDENKINKKNFAESEDQDYFKESFLKCSNEIDMNLDNLKLIGNGDINYLHIQFSELVNRIQELQNYLSTSTLFLPDYSIKSCQNIITNLTSKLDGLKIELIPKRKFGFKNKQIVNTTTSVVPTTTIPTLCNKNNILSTDVNDNRKKPSATTTITIDWTIQNKLNEEFLLTNNMVDNKDITISTLTNCLIQIHGHPGSLQLTDLTDCIILCGPISRSIFITNCKNCKFAFSCQQLRLHSSINCEIYLHVTCRGIIEDCYEIKVAPYNYKYSQIDIDYIKSGLDFNKNNWNDIADFNWLSSEKQSPNWLELNEIDRIDDWNNVISTFRHKYNLI